jgi:hypothetical protein
MALPAKKNKAIEISLRQYVSNPYRGSAFLASRKAIKAGLNQAFIELLRKDRMKFFAVPYIYPNGDILFHVRIPSTEYKYNKLHYDVLFKIKADPVRRYALRDVEFFSNSPSFIYTYAYVYYHDHIVIDEFASKLPIMSLTVAPEIRNPVESLGYEKSTYFAARYLIDGHALTDQYIQKYGKKINKLIETDIMNKIADPDDIVQIYALGRQLQAKESSISQQRTKHREKLQRDFVQHAKKTAPRSSGKILAKKPRSKITARKARRSL